MGSTPHACTFLRKTISKENKTIITISVKPTNKTCWPHSTVVWKFFDRKYFLDKKIQGKIFSWMHDFLKIFLP